MPEIEFFVIFNPLELFFGSCAKDGLIIGGIRARPISALAALSGLGVPKYAFTPLALPARKSGFVNNPG
ncbi:MAG: hypothetical protein JRI97_11200 [Deltaproteobacteria bacterium]|nr:hypothetical protein [Deltaproteobacteria bacterium]